MANRSVRAAFCGTDERAWQTRTAVTPVFANA